MTTEHLVSRAAGIAPDGAVAEALAGRADILDLTTATHEAILRPREPGGISHGERAALACRIALLHGEQNLADYYRGLLPGERGEALAGLADPSFDGGDDARRKALLAHVDKVSRMPREASGADIVALREAGWEDADIVRLSEIIAFLSYQLRVVAGLRLLETLS
jgi:uncharacterized protein YciW